MIGAPDNPTASGREGPPQAGPIAGFDRVLRAAFGVGLIFVPWAPDALMTAVRKPLFGLAALLAAVVFADRSRDLRARSSPVYWLATIPYAAFALVYVSSMTVFAVDSVPGLGATLCAWVFPVASLLTLRRRRLGWAWHLVATALASGWAASVSPQAALIVVGAGIYLAVGLAVLARRRVLESPSAVTLALHAVAVASLLGLYVYHQGVRPDLASEIEARDGVRVLWPFDDRPAARALGSAYMSAARLGRDVVLGPGLPNRRLVVLPGGVKPAETIAIGRRVGDNVEPDPADPARFYVGAENGVLVLRSEPVAVERTLEAPGGLVNFVRFHAAARQLILSRDNGRTVGRLPLDAPGEIRETELLGEFDTIFNVCVDEPTARFFASVVGPSGWRAIEGDIASMAWGRSVALPRSYGYFLETDPERRRLYAASYHTGEVFSIDADSLTVLNRRRVGRNARNITWDARRRLLYISDAVAGELIAYRPDDGRVTARLPVGPLARQATLDATGDTLLLRSSVGIIELRPDEWATVDEGVAPGGPTKSGAARAVATRFTMPWMIRLRSWME